MNILLLSSYLPYPLSSGGHVRLFNILKELSHKHEITLVCEKRDYQTEKDINEVKKICKKVLTFDRRKQWSWQNIIKTGFSTKPFLITGHINQSMQKAIKEELLNNKFDLIHVETFYVMQNLPASSLPVVLVEHNIEYLVYKRYADGSSLFLRPLLYIDILKLKYMEEKFWREVDKLVAVSDEEKKLMGRTDVVVIPNGVDLNKFRIKNSPASPSEAGRAELRIRKKEKMILFIGDFRWIQNVDAVRFILEKIWPAFVKTSAGKPKIKLWIVGKNIPRSIKRLTNNSSVIFDENAPNDTTEIFQKTDLLIAPIRIGGGTSFKILEAMASGVPVITTTLGNTGINAKNNREIIICDDTSSFVKKTMEIFENENLYEAIVKNARKLIEEKYDWKKIIKKLEEVYGLVA